MSRIVGSNLKTKQLCMIPLAEFKGRYRDRSALARSSILCLHPNCRSRDLTSVPSGIVCATRSDTIQGLEQIIFKDAKANARDAAHSSFAAGLLLTTSGTLDET